MVVAYMGAEELEEDERIIEKIYDGADSKCQ